MPSVWVIGAAIISFLINQTHPFTQLTVHAPTYYTFLYFYYGKSSQLEGCDGIRKSFLLAGPMTWVVAQQFQADAEDIINTVAGGTGSQLETSGVKFVLRAHLHL